MIVDNLKLPYYAVIFTTTLSDDTEGYYEMAEKMDNLAKEQDGYLGVESTRSNVGITVSH
uniref:antibiotic biosynthesis monooxygenase family protein n=1 Tax=uncultured Tenacibaculum sp. TaxID=174713 RepID=UPI0034381B88